MNRRNAWCVWLRDLTVNSRSIGADVGVCGVTWGVVTRWTSVAMSTSFPRGSSAKPDTRIQDRVQQVGNEVEQHDEERRNDQQAEHDVEVALAQSVLCQVATHAVPVEDGLSDDGAPEDGTDTKRDHRRG